MSKCDKQPLVLITVRGGVATAYEVNGAASEIIDFDNWECDYITVDDLIYVRDILERLDPDDALRSELKKEIEELADDRLDQRRLNDMLGDKRFDREVQDSIAALHFFGFVDLAGELSGRHEELKDKAARRKGRK